MTCLPHCFYGTPLHATAAAAICQCAFRLAAGGLKPKGRAQAAEHREQSSVARLLMWVACLAWDLTLNANYAAG